MAQFLSNCHVRLIPLRLRRFSSCVGEKKGLVLGVYEEGDQNILTPAAKKFNETTRGKLQEFLKLPGKSIKEGKHVVFWGLDDEFGSVALVGLGKPNKSTDSIEMIDENKEAIRCAASGGCRALADYGIKNIAVEDFTDAEAAAEGSTLGVWKFQEYNSKKEAAPSVALYDFCKSNSNSWKTGVLKANSQNLARSLADTPANLLTPTIFSERMLQVFKGLPVNVDIHDEKWAESQGMRAFLSVAQGSNQAPKFVELTYNAGGQSDFFVLVGKGVTFDAGGISLKPSSNMDEMRADMGGAAACAAALHGLAQLGVDANVKVLIPLCENLPSGKAIKPGDVITAKNGKTICVDNTDAEGRLILADALCYSATFKPKLVLDVATLTGAMAVAIGNTATGVFTNSNQLYACLEKAAALTGDRVWRFPLWKAYTKQLKTSDAFDFNNISKERGGGSCTAAAFLKEFVPEGVNWFHLDMASVMGPKDPAPYLHKGMTGRPTRTLIEFIKSQV